ncbi:MAG: outer membrane protein assembly factor BamC [Pseudomonadota bacterium]
MKPALTTALTSVLVVGLTGCGMLGSIMEQDRVDYRGAKKANRLDVPPDLTQLARDNRYAVPDGRGVASASTYRNPNSIAGALPAAGGPQVGVQGGEAIRVERAGNHRWLVVNQTPEQLWPVVKQFWADAGFTLLSESAVTGTMETDWAENRAKIPQDILRRTLGKVFDSMYGTGERDRYRTRLERLPNGSTEIYISHRGAEEVYANAQKDSTVWTVRPNDPQLEAAFLARLMARLYGTPEEVKLAESVVAAAPNRAENAKLVAAADGGYVEVNEGYDRAWRRVGLALDRVGFTVEDRDRVQGVYFVRYVDPDLAAKEGFLSKLLSFGGSDKAKEAQKYRVSVKADASGSSSRVTVQGNDGKPETSPTGAKILKLLNDELK